MKARSASRSSVPRMMLSASWPTRNLITGTHLAAGRSELQVSFCHEPVSQWGTLWVFWTAHFFIVRDWSMSYILAATATELQQNPLGLVTTKSFLLVFTHSAKGEGRGC